MCLTMRLAKSLDVIESILETKSMHKSILVSLFSLLVLFGGSSYAQENADEHIRRSHKHLAAQDFDGALSAINRAIEIDPNNVAAYRQRILINQLKGDLRASLSDYDRALALRPNDGELFMQRGNVKLMTQDANGAVEDFKLALANGYRHDGIYAALANDKMQKRDLAGAEVDFTAAINLNPRRVQYYLGRASVLRMQDKMEAALIDLNFVIENFERREKKRIDDGKAPSQTPEFDIKSAPIIIERPVQNEIRSSSMEETVTTQQMRTAQSTVRFSGSSRSIDPRELENYTERFENMQNIPTAYVQRAALHAAKNQIEAAYADLDSALKINPKSGFAFMERAHLNREQGKLKRAIEDYRQAVKFNPNFPFPRIELAATLLMTGEKEEGEAMFVELLKEYPQLKTLVENRRNKVIKDLNK